MAIPTRGANATWRVWGSTSVCPKLKEDSLRRVTEDTHQAMDGAKGALSLSLCLPTVFLLCVSVPGPDTLTSHTALGPTHLASF